MRVIYLTLRVLGVLIMSLLISVDYKFSEVTLIQFFYVLYFLFSLSVLPIYYKYGNSTMKLKRKIKFNINTIKITLAIIYVVFAVIFDMLKLVIFNDKVLYMRPFYFYGVMIIVVWNMFFDKKNKVLV